MKYAKVLIVMLTTVSAYATSYDVELQPDEGESKDTFIEDAYPDDNFGESEFLNVSEASGLRPIWSLIQFDLSPYAGANVTVATLKLYAFVVYNNSGNAETSLCGITGPWDEMTVTWDNKPDDAGEYQSYEWPGQDEWHEMDVTEPVQGWLNGDYVNYGLYLKPGSANSNDYIGYKSANGYATQDPILSFTITWSAVEPASLGAVKAAFR